MTSTSPLELLREAMAAVRAKDTPRTRKLLLEATKLDPRNETAWQWLAGVAETPLEATKALETVLALNPNNEKARSAIRPVRLQAGIAAAKARDVPTARRLLRATVADDARNEHGWLWLASVCDSPAESLAHLDRVLAINPTNAMALKGVTYYKAKLAAAAPKPKEVPNVAAETPRPKPTAAIPPSPRRSAIVPPKPRPKMVLVVDDSRTIRKLVSMTMTSAGFRVVEAEDGNDAINRIRDDGVPDLILLDVTMPEMDGYELCRTIRLNPDTKKVPVIMLTGKDGFFDKIRGRLAGTNAYLSKPLNPKLLLATVEKHVPLAVKTG